MGDVAQANRHLSIACRVPAKLRGTAGRVNGSHRAILVPCWKFVKVRRAAGRIALGGLRRPTRRRQAGSKMLLDHHVRVVAGSVVNLDRGMKRSHRFAQHRLEHRQAWIGAGLTRI